MQSLDLDTKISNFLNRKHAEFPELTAAGRDESRTIKYAAALRDSGQLLFTR
jgi:hypothetical protein